MDAGRYTLDWTLETRCRTGSLARVSTTAALNSICVLYEVVIEWTYERNQGMNGSRYTSALMGRRISGVKVLYNCWAILAGPYNRLFCYYSILTGVI